MINHLKEKLIPSLYTYTVQRTCDINSPVCEGNLYYTASFVAKPEILKEGGKVYLKVEVPKLAYDLAFLQLERLTHNRGWYRTGSGSGICPRCLPSAEVETRH